MRHAVIDVADPNVVQAEIGSMEKVARTTDEYAYPFSNPLLLEERITEHLPRCAEDGLERQPPDIPKKDSTMSDRQLSHVHLNEWSGDTLVESEAQAFLQQQRLQRDNRQTNGAGNSNLAITPKRRIYPSLRSGMSPSEINVRDWFPSPEECEALINASQGVGICPSRSHRTVENHEVVRNDSPDPRNRSSSDETVRVHPLEQQWEPSMSPAHQTTISADNRTPSDIVPSSSTSNASTPSKTIKLDSPGGKSAPKRTKLGNKPIERKPWQPPSQEDFSPRSRYRIRGRKPASPSPIKIKGTAASDPKKRRLVQHLPPNRVRSRSLDQPDKLRGVCLSSGTPGKPSILKQSTCTVGRAIGRRLKPLADDPLLSPESCENKRQIGPRCNLNPFSSLDGNGQDSPSAAPRPAPLRAKTRASSRYRASPVQAASDASLGNTDESSRPVKGGAVPITSGWTASDDNSHLSLENTDSGERAIDAKHDAGSGASTPDINDRPWLRRTIPSSRYFSPSPAPAADAKRVPFWIKDNGKLYVCFPSTVEHDTYRVEIHARVHLSQPDEQGWYSFSVPGLPQLETSQPGGHLSFCQHRGNQIEVDRSCFEYMIKDGPYLVSGVSHFATNLLLRLHFCTERQLALGKHIHGITTQSIDRSPLVEQRAGQLGFEGSAVPDLESLGLSTQELHNYWREDIKSRFENRLSDTSDAYSQEHFMRMVMKQGWDFMPELPRPVITPPRCSTGRKSDTVPHKRLQAPTSSPVTLGPFPHAAETELVDIQLLHDELSEWANQKIRLTPAYFAGLFTRDDPLEREDPSKLSWNLEIRIDRNIYGELECQTSLEVPLTTTPPFLTIDAHDWIPNFSTIDGSLATQCEWRETEAGDLALWKVVPTASAKPVKVQLRWKELAAGGAFSNGNKDSLLRSREYLLPTILDKTILDASLVCNVDNALLVLNDAEREEVTWRADSMIACNSIRLPKLSPGYRMRLVVDESGAAVSDEGFWGGDMEEEELEMVPGTVISPLEEEGDKLLVRGEEGNIITEEEEEEEITAAVPHLSSTTMRIPAKKSILKILLPLLLLLLLAISFFLGFLPEQALRNQHVSLDLTGHVLDYRYHDSTVLGLRAQKEEEIKEAEAEEIIVVVKEENWRDRIDRALGWRG